MATRLSDNGDAAVLVLLDGQGRLDEDAMVLPGGGAADVFVDEDGDTLVQVSTGKVRTHELVRAVLRSPALTVYGDVLDLVVATTTDDYDRFVLSADLEHRHLWTRQWHEAEAADAPVVALVGLAPDRTETDGGDGRSGHMEAGLRLVEAAVGAPAKLHLVDLLTRRQDQVTSCSAGDRRRGAGQRKDALAEADVIVAAWGAVPETCGDAVDATVAELQEAREAGARILVPAGGGVPVVAGGQPARTDASGVDGLVDAPAEWVHGGQLG